MLDLNSPMGFGFTACHDRLVDVSPCSDVDRCDVVRGTSVATAETPKQVSPWSVSPLVSSTKRTRVAGSSRIHRDHRNSSESRFVFNELSELVESPRAEATTLGSANRYPLPDAFEVFNGDPSMGVFSLSHQTLGDVVVNVSSESFLSPRELLEMSLRTSGPAFLEISPEFTVLLSYFINFNARVSFAVTIVSQMFQPEVYTQGSDRVKRCRFRGFNCRCEGEGFVSEDEVCFSPYPVYSGFLVLSYSDWNLDSTLNCENRGMFESFPREKALIVDYGSMNVEPRFYLLIPLVCLGHLGDGSDRQLSREVVSLSDPVVGEVVELPVVRYLVLEGYLGYVVAGFVEPFHRSFEEVALLLAWGELHQKCLLHLLQQAMDYLTPYLNVHSVSSPRLKSGVSTEEAL